MLIRSPRHTPEDLEIWGQQDRQDAVRSLTDRSLDRKIAKATAAIRDFLKTRTTTPYIGVSWGKDSVVVADLALLTDPTLPLVHCRYPPIENPDCDLVRDAFLAARPTCRYSEVSAPCRLDADGWHATGTMEEGFRLAALLHTGGYISGIRAGESATRKWRHMSYGENTKNTCAPISSWSGDDVFAYLRKHELPVHPTYAMSMGGIIPRERLRVSHLTLRHGDGMGRAQWERTYYRDALEAIATTTTANYSAAATKAETCLDARAMPNPVPVAETRSLPKC